MSGWGPPPPGYGLPPVPPPNPMNPMGPMGFGAPPPPPVGNNGLATASFVCGILAIVPGCCCGLFGLPLSLIAIVTGVIGINQINAAGGQAGGRNLAIAGIVCGAVAICTNIGASMFHLTEHLVRSMHI